MSDLVVRCGAALLLDHQNCSCGGRDQMLDLVPLPGSASWDFRAVKCINVDLILVCGMLLYYVCIFFLIGKKARAFQELEFIKLVNKLKHWLLFFPSESGYNPRPYELHPFLLCHEDKSSST